MNILESMSDPKAFAPTFKRRLLRGDTWAAWKVFLAALFALPLTDEQRAIFERHTGRTDSPAEVFRECFVVAGRRSGKSLIAALVAVFFACFRNYDAVLAPGETGTVVILSSDRRQARVIFNYVVAFLEAPLLKSMVSAQLKESVILSNRVTIEIHTSDFRAVRGYTIVAAICDEVAFWPAEDTANPDTETLNAIRPAMATIPDALLLCISSPYAKKGELWRAYRENHGKPSNVLVWKASSREMNTTLSPAVVAAAYLRDASSARAEYGGEFRDDLADFISFELVEACVIPRRLELPPVPGKHYLGFVDSSGGRSDSMCLGIAHAEGDKAVLDLLAEVEPPFVPSTVVEQFARSLRRYRISEATGDEYAAQWVVEQFSKMGIQYRPAQQTRSELYLEALPALTSRQIELLDNRRMVNQFVGLERRVGRSGKDSIDHSPGGHDDLCNTAAGAVVTVMRSLQTHGLLKLWEQQAAALAENIETPETPEEQFKRRADAGMQASTDPKVQHVFGAPVNRIVPTRVVQKVTESPMKRCPNCGAPLASCGVSGISGDITLSCGACGFEERIPARVLRVRG